MVNIDKNVTDCLDPELFALCKVCCQPRAIVSARVQFSHGRAASTLVHMPFRGQNLLMKTFQIKTVGKTAGFLKKKKCKQMDANKANNDAQFHE